MTMELHRFRLREETDTAAFWEADEQLQERWYYQQPGVTRRLTSVSDDGWWVSLVWWSATVQPPDTSPLLFFLPTSMLVDASTLSVERFSGRPD